jgi:thermitase
MSEPDPPKSYERAALPADVTDQIIIGFKRELGVLDRAAIHTRIAAVVKALDGFGARKLYEFIAAPPDKKAFFAIAIVRLDGPTLDELRDELKKEAYADVGWVERNALIGLAAFNDPLSSQQWALDTLGAHDPWTVTPPPGKTIVGIVDSGLRRSGGGVHADLGLVEPLAVCQPPGLFPNCMDGDGHGTFLAGTIAAVPGNNVGIGSAVPPAWNISLLPVQFFSPGVEPNAAFAAIAIVHAAFNPFHPLHRARIINASWHVAPSGSGLATLQAALLFAKAVFDCLIVFAAGNDGTDNEVYPLYPANFVNDPLLAGNVIAVAATDRYDAKAFFSNYGRNTVAIAAPGMRILTTARYLVAPPRYAEYSGTSAAAAYVSAGAALVFALNPGWTARQVIQHLTASAETVPGLQLACIGGKRLNLKRAVYGPLHITAPVNGAILNRGAATAITWSNDYNNPGFGNVRIEVSKDKLATIQASFVTGNIGAFACPPNFFDLNAPGSQSQIRITPTTGNFPTVSGLFKVV